MRHQYELGLFLLEERFQRGHKAIGGVRLQLGRLEVVHLRHFCRGDFFGDVAHAAASYGRFQRPAGFSGDRLRSGDGLPGNTIQLAFALLYYNQDGICHFDPILSAFIIVIPNRL